MKCPYCLKAIDDKLIGKHLGRKGGEKSVRKLSPEDAKKTAAQRGKGNRKKL